MDLPRRFSYNPQWRIILVFLVPGIAVMALAEIHRMSFGVGTALGVLPAVFASLLTLRRFAFPRFLEVEQNAILLPTGFLHIRTTKIPYADIDGTREIRRKSIAVSTAGLCLYVKGRVYSFSSTLLPDMASYVAVRDFVKSRVIKADQPLEGGKYCFKCSYEGNGEIHNSNGELVWRTKTLHTRPHYPYGFFRLPDFVVYDETDKELSRIKLERKWPLAQFMMVENGLPICTIRQQSILLNKYSLDFANGQRWVFRMPLFTVIFGGLSKTGEKVRVRLWSHNIWVVLMDTSVDNPQLVAALAFIHRERLRCN